MRKKILITGVAGFIGSNLADRLLSVGYEIIGIDSLAYGLKEQIPENVDFHQIDIRSKNIFPLFDGIDVVFHLAAKNDLIACQEDPVETIDINIHGTSNVFEAARRARVSKVVFASSSALEEGEARLRGFYAISKLASEKIAEGYFAASGLNYVLLRYFNVYGPRQDYRRAHQPVMSSFIVKALKKESPTFYEGYKNDGRDFIYIDDVNDFHILCIENNALNNRLFKLGSGYSTSIQDVWSTVKKISGVNVLPEVVPGPAGHVPVITLADISDAKKVSWQPKTSLEDGLRREFDYLRSELAKGNLK